MVGIKFKYFYEDVIVVVLGSVEVKVINFFKCDMVFNLFCEMIVVYFLEYFLEDGVKFCMDYKCVKEFVEKIYIVLKNFLDWWFLYW